jgi:hypothetical protein
MKCPTCGKALSEPGGPYEPFCSKRCQLLDLAKWLGEEYRIPGPSAAELLDDEVPPPEDEDRPGH